MLKKQVLFITGLSFPDLYQKCRESFLVSSDLTLHAQLTEFHDHKLIRMKKVFKNAFDTISLIVADT